MLLTSKYFASFLLFAIHGVALSPLEKADSILDFSENFFSDGVGTLDQNVTSPSTMDNAAIFFISDFKRPIFKMVLVLINNHVCRTWISLFQHSTEVYGCQAAKMNLPIY